MRFVYKELSISVWENLYCNFSKLFERTNVAIHTIERFNSNYYIPFALAN